MYWVLGGDQKEYGPVTFEQVRQWIREQRLNAQSSIRTGEMTGWRVAAEFPEFADLFLPPAALPPPISAAPPPGGEFGTATLARNYRIDVVGLLERAWDLFKRYPWLLIGGNALVLVIGIGVECIPILGLIIGAVLFGPFVAGVSWLSLKLVRGQIASATDVFAGFGENAGQLIAGGIVYHLAVAIGTLLCLVPGLWLMVIWIFPFFLMIDRQMPFWDAMELSRKVAQQNFWEFAALMLIMWLIASAGFFALLVGVLVAFPVIANMAALAYEDIFYPKQGALPSQPVPPPVSALPPLIA